jgi:hypothetical protein
MFIILVYTTDSIAAVLERITIDRIVPVERQRISCCYCCRRFRLIFGNRQQR